MPHSTPARAVDCYFYPEGSSVTNATFISEQTLPCIQPPPPPPSVCGNGQQRFGPGGNACQTGPNSPEGVNEPTVTWLGLTVAQAFLNCEAEGKTGCCHYRSTTGLTRFIAGGVSVQSQGFPNDMTAACTEPSPPPPRPPALCQAFGSRPGIQCKANPDTTAPDRQVHSARLLRFHRSRLPRSLLVVSRLIEFLYIGIDRRQPRQWFFIAPEVCFAECEKQGKTGCCDHRTDPSSHGICQFWSGGAPSLRPDPGGQYADMYAGSCIGASMYFEQSNYDHFWGFPLPTPQWAACFWGGGQRIKLPRALGDGAHRVMLILPPLLYFGGFSPLYLIVVCQVRAAKPGSSLRAVRPGKRGCSSAASVSPSARTS